MEKHFTDFRIDEETSVSMGIMPSLEEKCKVQITVCNVSFFYNCCICIR